LVVHGSPASCAAQVRRYVDAGVTTPVVRLLGVGGEDGVAAALALGAAWL